MEKYCRIQCLGLTPVPINNWITSAPMHMNRLIYILDGEGGYIQNGKKIFFEKKRLYLLPGLGDINMWSSFEPVSNRVVMSYANFELLPPIMSKEAISFDPESDSGVKSALESFNTVCDNCINNNVRLLEKEELTFFKSIVVYITEKMIKSVDVKMVEDKTVLTALNMMHKNLSQKPSIAQIAKACSLTTDGFIRRFKKCMGKTPYSYLKKLKIRTALNLRDSGFSLEEIAEQCGYSDATTLSHAIANLK